MIVDMLLMMDKGLKPCLALARCKLCPFFPFEGDALRRTSRLRSSQGTLGYQFFAICYLYVCSNNGRRSRLRSTVRISVRVFRSGLGYSSLQFIWTVSLRCFCEGLAAVVFALSIGKTLFLIVRLGLTISWNSDWLKWKQPDVEKGVCQPKIGMNCKYANSLRLNAAIWRLQVSTDNFILLTVSMWNARATKAHWSRKVHQDTAARTLGGCGNGHKSLAGDSPNLLTASSLRSAWCQ